ncbi:hypothetical protein HOD19_00040 [bacterium]|jgi:hypothetical protein|nr:hypothetical protein [bacterium]MBT4649231.1 hypothetical protein [bacterium]
MGSILDQVMTAQQLSHLSEFNPAQTVERILEVLSEREQEILKMRHGLAGFKKKTLEEIGGQYNITRERVRQIENSALKKIIKNFDQNFLKQIEDITNAILTEHGGMMSEENLITELLVVPGATPENKAAINFVLNQLLNHRFHFVKESKKVYNFWKTPEASIDSFDKVIESITDLIHKNADILALEVLVDKINDSDFFTSNEDLSEKMVLNYLDITKKIKHNPYQEWGLSEWPSITPKRMNDKIYVVLRKENTPLHFTEIAETINKMKFDQRQAYPATIHNELILDKKYVLVGRGIYALKEWGYKPGVVSDVIEEILKDADRPMSKKEITKAVLDKRMIKETTITLALMNKDRFARDEKGRYLLKQKDN